MGEKKLSHYRFTVEKEFIDEYGHLNNARYLEFYERARWNILEKSDLGPETIKVNQIGPVILEVTVRFSRELLLGEEITIVSSVRRKNDLIFYFDQQMINSSGKTASKAVFTAALFDLKKRKMVRPDENWLKVLGFQG